MSPRAICRAAAAGCIAPARKSATRAISCSPPRASSSTCLRFPLGDLHQGGDARGGAPLRAVGRRQGRQPGHLLRAAGPLYRHHREADAGRGRSGRDRRSRRPRARPPPRHHPFHHRPAERPRRLHRHAALCGAARSRDAARHRRPARCLAHAAYRAARRQLDRRGHARRIARSRPARGIREGALHPQPAAGVADARRRRSRGRTDRRRGWRRAGPGLRVLRRGRRPGARARRRLHQEHAGDDAQPPMPLSPNPSRARQAS